MRKLTIPDPKGYGVYADSPDALIGALPSVIDYFGGDAEALPLTITLPCCGATKVYGRPEDLPRESVGPCECGNWFIYYKETPL